MTPPDPFITLLGSDATDPDGNVHRLIVGEAQVSQYAITYDVAHQTPIAKGTQLTLDGIIAGSFVYAPKNARGDGWYYGSIS